MKRAFFLDRDGVINRKLPENQYVRNWEEFEFIPGAVEAIRILNRLGFLTLIITNQRGIGRKFMTAGDLNLIHQKLSETLNRSGAELSDIFYCPHEISDNCICRKPKPGMIWQALAKYEIDLTRSFLAGDSAADILLGKRVGCQTFLITPTRPLIEVIQQHWSCRQLITVPGRK